MRTSLIVRASGITLALAVSLLGQPSSSPPSYRFTSDNASLGIPVELIAGGLAFVQARVNGHAGWFIVDNGTEGFVVDRDYARRVSLQSNGTAVTRGVGSKASETGVVRDVSIGLPGLELTHRSLVIVDLKDLPPSVGHEVDGIIGSALFNDLVVVVDYEHPFLSVYAPNGYHPSGKEKAFPVRVDQHGFQYIDATISLPAAAPVTGSFLIDGGANYYASLYKPFSDAHHLPPSTMKVLDDPGMGQPKDGLGVLMSIGPYSVDNPPISFAQDVEGLMASKDYAGLIGAKVLERFTVVFDNPGRRILLTPNRNYAEAAEYDESGLRIHAEGPGFHKFVVKRIVPNSPAAVSGIEPGDVIESVDELPATEFTLTTLRKMLCRPKARYPLQIARGNSHLRVTLQMRPLL